MVGITLEEKSVSLFRSTPYVTVAVAKYEVGV